MVTIIFTRAAFAAVASLVFASSAASTATAQGVSYYEVPKGDGPHDVTPAPDGTVWYAGQRAGVLRPEDRQWGSESGTDRLVVIRFDGHLQ